MENAKCLKRSVSCIVLCILMVVSTSLVCSQSTPVYGDVSYELYINNLKVDLGQDLIEFENEFLVPVRAIAEYVGLNVEWNSTTQQITFYSDTDNLKMVIDSKEYTFNNSKGIMEVAPTVVDQRTFVPLLFVMQAFGGTFSVDRVNGTINAYYHVPVPVSDMIIYNNSIVINKFECSKKLTRAEFARFLVKSFKLDERDVGNYTGFSWPYIDVPTDHEYYNDIYLICKAGYFQGYPDGAFSPNGSLTKAEYAVVILRALGYENTRNEVVISDLQPNFWAYNWVQTAVDAGLMSLTEDYRFEPNSIMTLEVTGQLSAQITPGDATNKRITWTSSDETVAVVDKTGHVTGISEGNAIISATTADGNIVRTCNVKVTNNLMGDLNADGSVNSTDLVLMKRYIMGIVTDLPADDDIYVSDVNSDKSVDSTDLTILKRYILKIINEFPIN